MPSKQAEAITAAITEVLNDSVENVSQSFVSKAEMQKVFFFFSLCLLIPRHVCIHLSRQFLRGHDCNLSFS